MASTGSANAPVRRMSPRGSVLWALIPLFTFGMGTPFVLAWAAHRLKSAALAVSAAIAFILLIIGLPLSSAPEDSARSSAGAAVIVVLLGGGLVATFMVRSRLVDPHYKHRAVPGIGWAPRTSPGMSRPGADPAIGEALARRQRRAEARRILEDDPALARELRIGRPDLSRRYDDGGLVDVNHAPAAVLADLPGFTSELAERVVRAREERQGFEVIQEMEVYADLPEGLAEEVAERLVFLR